MRRLAIGDIHGCYKALLTLADLVPFRPDDLIITLGDYVDRGPDSCAVIDWLIARHAEGTLIPMRGNHELMMLEARENAEGFLLWAGCGGAATLASYSLAAEHSALEQIPEAHWAFLEGTTQRWHEIETHFFVHASAYHDCPLAEQPDYMLFWETFEETLPHRSGKIMVCGHTSQRSGKPRVIGHAICIDTWAYGRGWLTCLDVDTGHYWQANQQGRTRTGTLEPAP